MRNGQNDSESILSEALFLSIVIRAIHQQHQQHLKCPLYPSFSNQHAVQAHGPIIQKKMPNWVGLILFNYRNSIKFRHLFLIKLSFSECVAFSEAKYPNLCELCTSHEQTCEYKNKNGHGEALECLINKGQVAYVSAQIAQSFFAPVSYHLQLKCDKKKHTWTKKTE